jgi:hypothetical protein
VKRLISIAFGLLLLTSYGHAQEAVTPAADADALFHSADPKLNANKQVAYMIIKDLLESGHWERASKYLTERYIQHNPLAASGRDGVVHYFVDVVKVKPSPVPEGRADTRHAPHHHQPVRRVRGRGSRALSRGELPDGLDLLRLAQGLFVAA